MPSYLGRLLLLSSASFFLVQIAVGALVASLARAAVCRAGTMRPLRAARFLITLRLLPTAFSMVVVAILCVPSYLRFEPRAAEEEVGFVCLAAAAFGVLFCAVAASRAVTALIRSARYVQQCGGEESRVEGAWIVRQSAGLALAGILRPRLLISENALNELSKDQLAVALAHETAHRASRDNLKRLLILLAPPIFPAMRLLERAWLKSAEWAADDRAANGDADRSAALAEALVRVARLQSGVSMPSLVTSLVEADEDLSERVDRLLEPAPVEESQRRGGATAFAFGAIFLLSIAMTSMQTVHRLLEYLLD